MVLNGLAAMLAAMALPNAGTASPRAFSSYPVAVTKVARRSPLQFRSVLSRRYRTDLREAATGPVNFAGHYVLTSIGCGAGCVQVAAIDAGAGSVTWLPPTVCCWPLSITEPLEYRRDSRLLVVHGALNEKGAGTHAFLLNGGRFALVLRRGLDQPR